MIDSLLPITVAIASVALAVGPADSVARRYVDALRTRAASARPEGATGPTAPPGEEWAADVRCPWLLGAVPQAGLALLLTSLTTAWGVSSGSTADTVVALPVIAVLGVTCTVDAVCHRLPNTLLLWAGLWVASATAVRCVVELAMGASAVAAGWPAARAVLCAVGVVAALGVMTILPSGLGMGDVKLWAVLALWLGRFAVWVPLAGLTLGFLLGGLVAVVLIVLRRVGRKDHIAFGPYLAAGAWLAWLAAVA